MNVVNKGVNKRNRCLCAWKTAEELCGQYISILLVFAILSGCGGVIVAGLHPNYPPLEKKAFATHCEFVEVDSIQPTFQWQPFPRPADGFAGRIQDVTYELRIWTTTQGPSGKLRYSRDGLKPPSHKLDDPLEPSIKYLWSVRARFMIDGDIRVTEWGMAGLPLRNESVPNLSCFRFKTTELCP